MLNIYLVRHGQDEDNAAGILNGHRDTPLTALGLAQAHELASFVSEQDLNFIKVYSSPLKRAYQTALEITKAVNLEDPEVLPELIERGFGVLTGKPISDIFELPEHSLIRTSTVTYFLDAPDIESFSDALQRAKKLLEKISSKYQAGNILLVSHGDFGKMIYAAYYNLPWEEVLKLFHFGNTEMILLSLSTAPPNTKVFKKQQFNN